MSLLTVTPKARARMQALLAKGPAGAIGLRFGTEAQGCSGLKYKVDYATAPAPGDEEVGCDGIRVFIEKASLVNLIGSTIDYEESPFTSGFVFVNPNEKSRCGCGESFTV
jgi:iron-sulfur cluster assembly protein